MDEVESRGSCCTGPGLGLRGRDRAECEEEEDRTCPGRMVVRRTVLRVETSLRMGAHLGGLFRRLSEMSLPSSSSRALGVSVRLQSVFTPASIVRASLRQSFLFLPSTNPKDRPWRIWRVPNGRQSPLQTARQLWRRHGSCAAFLSFLFFPAEVRRGWVRSCGRH